MCAQGLGDVTYTWLDKQDDPNGKPLSRVMRIRYADAREAGSTVAFELDGARNYAGTAMARWASGELVVGVRADKLKLNAGIYNLTDKKYWNWSDVRGVASTSNVLDAYTQPGRNVRVSLVADF